jgi:hypothetical protein
VERRPAGHEEVTPAADGHEVRYPPNPADGAAIGKGQVLELSIGVDGRVGFSRQAMEGRFAQPALLDELELALQVCARGEEDQSLGRPTAVGCGFEIGPAPAQDPVATHMVRRLQIV